MRATAIAHPNIALAKYWGKRDVGENLPAVPSISVTLAGMTTTTTVAQAERDVLVLDGEETDGRPLERVQQTLDLIQPDRPRMRVESRNDFPTAAGLASSASAFAALAVAADAAFGTDLGAEALSSIARRVSASAGRSVFGGFVELGTDGVSREIAAPDHWDLRLVVCVTAEGKKEIGSTPGMQRTAATSPLYAAWVEAAPALCQRVREALLARDFAALGPAMEQSALTMHASALAADPGLIYWRGATVDVMRRVRELRAEGLSAYFTIDAGPHVKVFTTADELPRAEAALAEIPGVLRTIVAEPGRGARVQSP